MPPVLFFAAECSVSNAERQSKWQPHGGQAGLAAQFGSLSIYRLISVLWNSSSHKDRAPRWAWTEMTPFATLY
jgi:hypothetical protein